MVAAGRVPTADPRVGSFIEALRDELAADSRSVCIIAGVDFAHVGRKFGDERAADEAFVKWVEQEDHALIENIVRGDPEGFFHAIDKDKDRRRICGLSPMYTQLELLRGRRGRLLKYDVALEPPTQSAVATPAWPSTRNTGLCAALAARPNSHIRNTATNGWQSFVG